MFNQTSPTEAIRALLFQRAQILTDHLLRRLADVASHVNSKNHRAVIGALDGLEAEVQTIRTLMVLMDECL
jgi:hypothetical protein